MPTCPECQHFWSDVKNSDFNVYVSATMKEACSIMRSHPNCKEEWKKFLSDMPGRTMISEKQRKFYSVIFKECFGKWPEKEEELKEPATQEKKTFPDPPDAPF